MSSGGYSIAPGPNYAAYANPNFGQQLGQIIANYPNDYFQGTQQRRQLELQKPIIDPATGEPSTDPNLVAKELMRRGGAEYSKDLIPFLQKQPIFDKILRENNEGGYDAAAEPTSPPPSRSNVSGADWPANLLPPSQRQPQGQPSGAPRLSSAGADNAGEETINSLASSVFGERDVTQLFAPFLLLAALTAVAHEQTQPPITGEFPECSTPSVPPGIVFAASSFRECGKKLLGTNLDGDGTRNRPGANGKAGTLDGSLRLEPSDPLHEVFAAFRASERPKALVLIHTPPSEGDEPHRSICMAVKPACAPIVGIPDPKNEPESTQ